MAASAQVLVRRAEAEDVEWVSSLASAERGLLRQRFGEFDVAQLIEQSFLSITALNDRGEVVGFATFSDAPAGPSADEAGGAAWLQWFRTKHGDDSTWLSNHIWLSFFVAHKSYALDAAESICRTVFTTLPETDAALLALPRAVDIFAPLNSSFEEVAVVTGDGGAAADAAAALPGADAFNKTTVYRCQRAAFIPNLTIRAARVEDHDDLVPVFNTQSEVLTDLYGEFYLAELIEAQDPTNRALVSEVDGRACGLMALTTDMQLDVLQRCFELDAYNNLLKRTRAELAADAEAERVALRERSDWLAQLHSHASELSATFDALSHADDPDRVNLAEFEAAFNRRGEEWGFIANRQGRGLGSVMVRDLKLTGDATQREVLNEAVEVYAEAKAAARKARNVHAWYSLHNGREVVFKAFSTAAAFEEKEAAARGEGAPPPEDEAEEEERLAAARVALGDLAALVGMLVRESGAKYLGENVGDELLDLLGLDDVAVADTPDDAEAKGAEGAADADAEGESKDGAAGGESKAAGDAGESKGESKGADAGGDGDNGDDGGDGEDGGGEGGDATSDAGADDAEEPIVRVSHAQVVTALDAFEATIRASQSVRLALLGGPGAGKKTVAKALASKLGLAVLNFGNLLADARYRADSEAQAAEDNDEEAVDKAAVVRAAVAERLQSEDCAKGWVFVNVPDDAEVVGTILSDLRASQLETVPVVLAAGDRQARQRRFGGSDPSEKEEENYVQASVSWRRKGDAVIAAAAGGASHVARVDANAAPEAVLQSVLDELSDAHLLPSPFEQDEADSEPLPEDESAPEHAESNAFAVTLFCLDELFDSRARDFLDHAFAMFPDREYCILTLPHSSMETPLLQQFWQVPARPESTFSHTLYILHRASLPSQGIVSVRPARVSDHLAIKDMVSGLARGAALMDAVAAAGAGADGGDSKEADAAQRGTAFVAECQGQVVGVCVMSRRAVSGDHLTTLRHKFDLECFLSMHQYQGGDFSALDHLVMNPVFTNTTSYVIRRCMRLHKCCVVMFRKGVADAIPPAVAELFVQVRPRRATAPPALAVPGTAAYAEALDDGPAPGSGAGGARKAAASSTSAVGDNTDDPSHPGFSLFGLFFLSRRLTSEPKLVVNSRVVVVGASDTSLALLEAMLTRPYLTFTNLVLVSPGGLPRAGPNRSPSDPSAWCIESQYSPEDLARLAFDARVRVVDARVVDIDRESRGIVVSGDGVMHYDRLVIATGLADHTASRAVVDLNDEGLVGTRVFSIAACLNNPSEPQAQALERAAQAAAASNPDVDPPVLVYGQSLDALCAIQALLSRGVRPNLIRQLVPPARRGSLDHEHVRTFVDNAVVDLGIDILYDATLVEATSAPDGSVHVVVDMGAGGADAAAAGAPSSRKVVATQLLLCADRKNVDPTMFRAINGCGLVYDGRLVLNHRFRTTQQEIFGAGPIAKFSRRYRSKHLLQDFNSREVGAAVATSLLQELDPLALPSVDDVPEEYATGPAVLPKFGLPCVSRGVLPGGLQYLDVCLPEVDVGDGAGRELDTRGGTDEAPNYCHVTVDRHGRLARLTYVGGGSVETGNLVTLVGRHTSFLNGLVRDYDAGHIADLISFFRGDWAQALYHDRFDSMVMELRDMLLDDAHVRQVVAQVSEVVEGGKSQEEISEVRNAAVGAQGSALPPSTRRTVETHVLEFLRANRKLLPMYFLPGVGGARVGSRGVVR